MIENLPHLGRKSYNISWSIFCIDLIRYLLCSKIFCELQGVCGKVPSTYTKLTENGVLCKLLFRQSETCFYIIKKYFLFTNGYTFCTFLFEFLTENQVNVYNL